MLCPRGVTMQLTKQHLPRPVTTPFRFPLFANAGSRRNSLWRGSRALMSVCAIVVSLANAQENPSHDDLSKQFMTSISQGKNAEVIAHFSPGLKATVTDAQMNAAWSSITQRLG